MNKLKSFQRFNLEGFVSLQRLIPALATSLNQVPAWFFEIALSVAMCVCPPPRLLKTIQVK